MDKNIPVAWRRALTAISEAICFRMGDHPGSK